MYLNWLYVPPQFLQTWRERLLISLLVASMLLQSLLPFLPDPMRIIPAAPPPIDDFAMAAATYAPIPAPIYALPPELIGKTEIVALRTANSASFVTGDGEIAVLQDSTPIHYQDAWGEWQPINPAFAVAASGWLNDSNTLHTSLAWRNSRARIGAANTGIGWEPQALEVVDPNERAQTVATLLSGRESGLAQRSVDGSAIRYEASWDLAGVQDQWQTAPGRSEYSMRLAALPTLPRPFWQQRWQADDHQALDLRVLLRLQPGTTLLVDGQPALLPLETRGHISFAGSDGEIIDLHPPRTYEQNAPGVDVAGSYLVTATADPRVVEVRVRTPWSWLAAPERQFPVIIDPLFQMRDATTIGTVKYDPANMAYLGTSIGGTGTGSVGRGYFEPLRLLVRFEMPRMPQNTVVNKAYLLAAPTDMHRENNSFIKLTSLSTKVTAYAVSESAPTWWMGSVGDPAVGRTQMPPGAQSMSYSANQTSPHRVLWDVTDAAKTWNRTLAFDPPNPGLILQAANEQCAMEPLPGQFLLNCSAFQFEPRTLNWSDVELGTTQFLSKPDEPYIHAEGKSSGLRLMVFYSGHPLANGVTYPSTGSIPMPPEEDPYYEANHVYTIPPLADNVWQAMVARSVGPAVGMNPPTEHGKTYRIPLEGGVALRLKAPSAGGATLGEKELRLVNPVAEVGKGAVSYILFNGRGAPSPQFDQSNLLYVNATATLSEPVGYDVRLISEKGTINSTLDQVQIINYEFDSADPLALWNVTLPQPGQLGGAPQSQITVRIVGDGTQNQLALSTYARDFRAVLLNSDNQADLPTSDPFNPQADSVVAFQLTQKKTPPLGIPSGPVTLRSTIFNPGSGQYALALAYDGPQITVNDFCDPAICGPTVAAASVNGDPIPVKYNVEIRVLTCPAGTFPTKNGACQPVKCPTTAIFPNNTTKYDEVGGLGLWSAGGWTADGSGFISPIVDNSQDAAPLLGPPGRGAPTVAIIGGRVRYDKTTNPRTLTVDQDSTVILIQCAPNVEVLSSSFTVFSGGMTLTQLGSIPFTTPALASSTPNSGENANYFHPFLNADNADLSSQTFYVRPDTGASHVSMATGAGILKRRTGMDAGSLVDLHFDAAWSTTVAGWPAMTSSVKQRAGDSPPSPIASLLVDLGATFELDVLPPTGNPPSRTTPRYFSAVRAKEVTITQDAQLGGASKMAQAVILPRGVFIPASVPVQCPASCIDLRALNDGVSQLRRVWEMPDVHVVAAANMVMYRRAGMVEVFSSDHPAAMNDGVSQEYSFDSYKASVSVQSDFCTSEDTQKVLVIRGETQMLLPNLGSSDPAGAITASFKLCAGTLRSVHMSFQSPVGIPIGSSGLFLTGLNGQVDIYPAHTRITFGLFFQAAPGGNGGIFKAHGEVIIDTMGLFAFQGNAKILGTVDVNGKLWVAWNPMDIGFKVSIGIGDWLSGEARAHMWQGQGFNHAYPWLPDNDEKHFAGSISATLSIREGVIGSPMGMPLPPSDISLGIKLAFGQFCVNASCTTYEWGIKGALVILDFNVGLYYGFDTGLDFILGNDGYVLIDEYGGAQGAPILAAEGDGSDLAEVQAAPQKVDGTATIPVTVTLQTEEILVAVGWQAGSPQLALVNPDGVEVTPANAAAHGARFLHKPTSIMMSMVAPKPGVWQARIKNLSEQGVEHYRFFYFANKGAPGPAGQHGAILKPANAQENGTGSYTITWQPPADTTDQATISLFYRRTAPDSDILTGTIGIDVPIVQNLPYKTGSFVWNTTAMFNGVYEIEAVIDDGVNDLPLSKISNPDDTCMALGSGLPNVRAFNPNRFPGVVTLTAPGTVRINDVTPPATPTGLQVNLVDGVLGASWNAAPASSDVTHYLLRWGARSQGNPSIFIVENQQKITVGTGTTLRIGAVKFGVAHGVDILALDSNGNASAPSVPQFATPDGVSNPAPLMPMSVTLAAVTTNSASFTWEAGEGPVPASYRLTYIRLDPSRAVGHLDVAATNGTLANLQTGAAYDVEIRAANAQGWQSVPSKSIRVVISNGVDANNDGLPDDWASANAVAGGSNDADGDGLANSAEYKAGTHPGLQDSDGDGLSDGEEIAATSDPLNANSVGSLYNQPRLWLDDTSLLFFAKKQTGGAAAAQTVAWQNVGGGELILKAASENVWIKPSIVGDKVTVQIDHTALAPGFYSGVVRLHAEAGSTPIFGAQSCIRVNAWVQRADDDTGPVQPAVMLYLPTVVR